MKGGDNVDIILTQSQIIILTNIKTNSHHCFLCHKIKNGPQHVDPEDVLQGVPYGNVEKFISLDAKFKEDDKYMDFKMETDQGLSEYHDLPINLKWVQFFNRQLKFSGEERFMFNYRIFGKSKLK